MFSDFEFRSLSCVASPADARSWEYLPLRPDVRRDANNAPILTLVDPGASGYLIFSATWGPSEADLEALRREIAIRIDEPQLNLVRLSFASVSAPRCHALIGDGTGAFQTVATSATSGIAPYDAAFNLFLQDEGLAHAKAALRGETGFLAFEYLADHRVPVRAKATFRANAVELLPWIRAQGAEGRELRPLLDEAVERGIASVAIESRDDRAAEMTIELYDRVMGQVMRTIPRWIEEDAAGEINVGVALEQQVNQPVRAHADVGAIVATA